MNEPYPQCEREMMSEVLPIQDWSNAKPFYTWMGYQIHDDQGGIHRDGEGNILRFGEDAANKIINSKRIKP